MPVYQTQRFWFILLRCVICFAKSIGQYDVLQRGKNYTLCTALYAPIRRQFQLSSTPGRHIFVGARTAAVLVQLADISLCNGVAHFRASILSNLQMGRWFLKSSSAKPPPPSKTLCSPTNAGSLDLPKTTDGHYFQQLSLCRGVNKKQSPSSEDAGFEIRSGRRRFIPSAFIYYY